MNSTNNNEKTHRKMIISRQMLQKIIKEEYSKALKKRRVKALKEAYTPQYEAMIFADYDEFAAHMGSEEDMEQPPTEHDETREFSSLSDAVNWTDSAVKFADDNHHRNFRGIVYMLGPRGGRKLVYDSDFSSWYKEHM